MRGSGEEYVSPQPSKPDPLEGFTPEQIKEFGLEAAPPHVEGFTPEQIKEFGLEPSVPSKKEVALTAAGAVGKGLDAFTGGPLLRGLRDKLMETYTGKKVFDMEDLKNAYNPTNLKMYPSSSASYEKAGMGKMGSLSDVLPYAKHGTVHPSYQPEVGGALDFTGRGAFGAVSDAMLSAQPLASLGRKAPGALTRFAGRLASPVSAPLEALSKMLYERPIKSVMAVGKRFGQDNIADTFFEEGMHGSLPAQIEQRTAAANGLKTSRDAILDTADAAGAGASKQAAYDPMYQQLVQMVKDQRITRDQAAKILAETSEAKVGGPDLVPTKLMTQWKTDTGAALPSSTWDELRARSPGMGNQVKRTLQKGFQNEVEGAVGNTLGAASQAELTTTNKKLGDLINPNVNKRMQTLANQQSHKPFFDNTDTLAALMAGLGYGTGAVGTAPEMLGVALAAKKGVNLLTSPGAQSTLGFYGRKAANSVVVPYLDSTAYQGAAQYFSPYQVPAQPTPNVGPQIPAGILMRNQ